MFILGIDVTTTHTRLHVDQVELYDAGDIAPLFLVETLTSAILVGQLQIDTRSQGHLVVGVTIVTPTIVVELILPFIETGYSIFVPFCVTFISSRISIVSTTNRVLEIDITRQGTKEVDDFVDAEVVAMLLVLSIASITGTYGNLLVQRYLTYTVDGVVGVIHYLRHTVLSTLHHHTAAEDTTEVGTLDGVHRATGIA